LPLKPGFSTIDEYIESAPEGARKKLVEIKRLIREVAPEAEERISYRMPAFFLDGILVWFAAASKHIGFYPKQGAVEVFKRELAGYKTSKGTIRFPIDKPLPINLIKKIVRYRIKENRHR